jgi:hypothetical protein
VKLKYVWLVRYSFPSTEWDRDASEYLANYLPMAYHASRDIQEREEPRERKERK